MADALFVVLRKVALSLGEGVLEKIGREVAEVAPIMTDFKHSIKQIEGELSILQAFIGQVSEQRVGDKAFDAWLDQVRDVAHEVEDIIDEYAYLTAQAMDTSSFFKRKFHQIKNIAALTAQAMDTSSFFKRKFHQIKNIAAWQRLPSQISEVEARIQRLAEMRGRYGISVGELDRRNNLPRAKQLCMSDSAYLTDNSEIVGHVHEIRRLTQWLFEEKQERSVVAILGMGGLGKTTVATTVYRNQQIRTYFDCSAWVTVSQTYHIEELLREILSQLIDQRVSMENGLMTMSRMRLVEVIQSYLQDKKYLIVLDDVWDKDAWLFLNYAFVRNNSRSEVLITTRRKDVSSLAEGNYVIELKTLRCTESWKLFCKKAFRASKDNICPENLRSLAEKIVGKCQGLPLAIVTIGSTLSYRELEEQEWAFFYNQLSWQLAYNPELNWISNVLNMSLHDLPCYLRSCFLYCSLYPEDYKIRRKLISRIWIAEGFVEDRGDGTTMEEVARYYLAELTQRSLLQITERNASGRARTFVMHDLVRDATLVIAKKEKFGIAYRNSSISQVADVARHLSIQSGAQSLQSLGSSRVRSFTLFDAEVPSSWIYDVLSRFRLLRVLCLRFAKVEQVPGIVTELYNLRYLDLSHTRVKQVPSSLGKLTNLQVLDLRFSYVEELPLEITQLSNLRLLCVCVNQSFQARILNCFGAAKIRGHVCHLKKLQSLYAVQANKDLVSQLGNLTLLRTLAILEMRQCYIAELWSSLTMMPDLSKLRICVFDMDEILDLKMLEPLPNLKYFWLAGKLEAGVLPSMFSKLEKLAWLSINWSGLKKDPIISLSHMLSLVHLQLCGTYGGEQLTFCAGWFPKLNFLQLADMEHVKWIEMEDGTMISLQHLEIVALGNLKAVPTGIKYLRTLLQMFLTDMSKGFIQRLQESDSYIVQHITSIHIFYSSDSQAVNNFHLAPFLARKYGPGASKYATRY